MRINRFFGDFNLFEKTVRSSDAELVNQLKNVLRLKKSDEIILCDGKLNEARSAVEDLNNNEAVFKVLETGRNADEFRQDVVLYCSLLKRENFELVAQKSTELGVKEIVPVVAAKTVKLGFKTDRLRKIIKEAAEQSGRGILPVLSEQTDFGGAIESAGGNDLNLFFELGGKTLGNLNLDFFKYKKIGIFIGPEGGWSEEELNLANNNFKIAGLSRFTLRAETAAIAALTEVTQQLQ